MPRHSRRAWFGLIGRLVVLASALALVATSAYVAVDVDQRPVVLRLAVAAFAAVALIHLYGPVRRQLDEAPLSAFDQARQRQPAEPKVAPMVLRLRDSVKFSVASQSYFEKSLWPRLVRLSEERGTRGLLTELRGRPWLRRGPPLAAIADLVKRIGDER